MPDRPEPDDAKTPVAPDDGQPEAGQPEGGRPDAGRAGPASGRDPHAAIVAELRARFGEAAAGPAVAIYLAARGYDPGQVTEVLARLAGAAESGDGEPAAPPLASDLPPAGDGAVRASREPSTGPPVPLLRAWAPHERARFTPEAWGRLLQLRASGLGDHDFEHLVDRALLQLDGPVTLAELRALLGDALGPGEGDPPTLH